MGVCKLDIQFLGSLDDDQAVAGANVMGDLGSIGAVLHEQHLKLLGVVNDNLAEAIRHHVASSSVASEANSGHNSLALEASANSIVDTSGFAPVFLGQC